MSHSHNLKKNMDYPSEYQKILAELKKVRKSIQLIHEHVAKQNKRRQIFGKRYTPPTEKGYDPLPEYINQFRSLRAKLIKLKNTYQK